MASTWPEWMTESFQIANKPESTNDSSAYYGPYNRLLHHLYGVDGPFEVMPQYHVPATPQHAIDIVATFTVRFGKHPVLFIEVKPPATFDLKSKREEADHQMRKRFNRLHTELITPRLPGISAFGTRLAFYEYTDATGVTPRAITPNQKYETDVAPVEQWNYDILEAAGIDKMRETVEGVNVRSAYLPVLNS